MVTTLIILALSVESFGVIGIVNDVSSAGAGEDGSPLSIMDIFNLTKSVVQIIARSSTSDQNIIKHGNPLGGQSTVTGQGFIYDTRGHIVTSSDVVNGYKNYNVKFTDGNTYRAKVLGADPSKIT